MTDPDTLRSELRALVAAPPPVADRSAAVRRRIERVRTRRLAVASASAVCTIIISLVALASLGDNSPERIESATGDPTVSVYTSVNCPTVTPSAAPAPPESCAPLVTETKDGLTLSIGIQRGEPADGAVPVTYLVTVHGDGRPVCGSTLSLSILGGFSLGNWMSYCGTADDTTFTVTPFGTYRLGEQVTVTASFSRTPDGTIPPTQTNVPQAPVLLTATARFTA